MRVYANEQINVNHGRFSLLGVSLLGGTWTIASGASVFASSVFMYYVRIAVVSY